MPNPSEQRNNFPENPSRSDRFSVRQIKETLLGKPANKMADFGVTPNMVTGIGLGMRAASVALRMHERSKEESTRRERVFWLASGLSLGALAMDGMDGSVYRAHKDADPEYQNENGQLVDGLTDRASAMLEVIKEVVRSVQEGNTTQAQVLAVINMLLPLPSYVRAKIEENGGKTPEQSFNPLTFGGTHAGRTLVIELLSLEKVQLDRMLGVVGMSLTEVQFANWRTGLVTYLAVSNGIVVTQRLWGWARSKQSRHDREASLWAKEVVAGLPYLKNTATGESIDGLDKSDQEVEVVGAPVDSAGLAKTEEDHRVRGFWYGVATLLATGSSVLLLAWIQRQNKAS